MVRCLSEPAYRRALLRHGVAAASEHESLLMQLVVRTIVDVGANRGQFSIAARRCFPNARIIAFEPLPNAVKKFNAVFEDDCRVQLHQKALGPLRITTAIHVSKKDDSSSLLPIGPLQARLFPGTEEKETLTVEQARLDELIRDSEIEKPALIKLDVQGFELASLKGCEGLIEHFTFVYSECSFIELYMGQPLAYEVVDWLARHGFRLMGVYNLTYDRNGRAVQGDFFFCSSK